MGILEERVVRPAAQRELIGAMIDHPEFHPFDGYALGNTLVINRETVDYQTFVVMPQ